MSAQRVSAPTQRRPRGHRRRPRHGASRSSASRRCPRERGRPDAVVRRGCQQLRQPDGPRRQAPDRRAGRRHHGDVPVHESITGTIANPAGWTLLQGKDGTATRGRAWTKKAVAADANANVTVTSSATIKDTMSVGVYRSDGGTSSVTASAQTAGTTTTASHASPTVAVAQANSWLVNSWSDKSSATQTWTKPATSTTRANPAATGSGKVSSLLADSGGAVATGTAAARTATTSTAAGGEQLFSVVVSPGTSTTTTNQPPVPVVHRQLHRDDLLVRRLGDDRPRHRGRLADLQLELRRRGHRHRRHQPRAPTRPRATRP